MTREATCPRCRHRFPISDGDQGRPLTCPSCGATTEDHRLWLPAVGVRVEAPPRAPESVQKESPATVAAGRACPHCGRPVSPLYLYCPACREPLAGSGWPRPTLVQRLDRGLDSPEVTPIKLILGVPALIVCIVVVAGAVLIAGSGENLAGPIACSSLFALGVPVFLGLLLAKYTMRSALTPPPAALAVSRFLITVFAWTGVVMLFGLALCVFLFAICAVARL